MKKLFEIFKHVKGQQGGAILNTLIAAAAVGAAGVMLNQSGEVRGKLTLDMNQNNVIENSILEMKTILANDLACKDAMDKGFQEIGNFKKGKSNTIKRDVYIDDITVSPVLDAGGNPTNGGRDKKIRVRFVKQNIAKKTQTHRADFLLVQEFTKTDGTKVCTSYETTGVDNTVHHFCEAVGGIYNSGTGKCDTRKITGPFRTVVLTKACESLGGTYDVGQNKCSKVDISGTVFSSHLQDNLITSTGGGRRTGFANDSCSGVQVGSGFNEDGTLKCKTITCPKPSTSTYSPIFTGGQLLCQCQRNSTLDKPQFACGQADPNSCTSYTVNDGCGTGKSCTIRRGKFPACPNPNPACGQISRNSCGEVCAVGPTCPPPPPPSSSSSSGGSSSSSSSGGSSSSGSSSGSSSSSSSSSGGGVCAEGNTRDNGPRSRTSCCLQWAGGGAAGSKWCSEPGEAYDICSGGKWTFGGCK